MGWNSTGGSGWKGVRGEDKSGEQGVQSMRWNWPPGKQKQRAGVDRCPHFVRAHVHVLYAMWTHSRTRILMNLGGCNMTHDCPGPNNLLVFPFNFIPTIVFLHITNGQYRKSIDNNDSKNPFTSGIEIKKSTQKKSRSSTLEILQNNFRPNFCCSSSQNLQKNKASILFCIYQVYA